jgi:SPP1 family predicted phage head-tail adaptor
VRAGDLNRRITLQQPVEATDAEGAITVTYTTLRTVWAAIDALTGNEVFLAGQIEAMRPVTITIRYQSDVSPRLRIAYGSRVFQIRSVRDVEEKHRELELLCEELDVA